MVIDTDKVVGSLKTHLSIVVPVGLGLLSWYAATRWQVAWDKSQVPMMVFYFALCGASGIVSVILTIKHLVALGFFGE